MEPAGDAVEVDTTGLTIEQVVERIAGLAKAMKVAVVGYPNVGKSSLVNRLTGSREAVVHERPGITRDRNEIACEWNGRRFTLIDTGGMDMLDADPISGSIREQAQAALNDAGRRDARRRRARGPAPGRRGDGRPAAPLEDPGASSRPTRSTRAPTCPWPPSSTGSGLGEPMPVSAAQGLGTGDLLDRVVDLLPPGGEEEDEDDAIRLALIGRPNVGKSTLVNQWLGEERVIVSEVAGTTRDAIDLPFGVDDRELILVDTAGMRRQSKVAESVEYYTTLRSQRAVERADVALVVCDARDGITAQDLRIAELAMKEGCATALVLNKWDIADEDDLEHERARVAQKLRLRPKVLTASAHDRPQRRPHPHRGDRARRPHADPDPDAGAQPLPRRGRPGPPAAGQAGPPAEADLHGPDRDARRASRSRSTRATGSRATTRTSSRTACARATGWTACR